MAESSDKRRGALRALSHWLKRSPSTEGDGPHDAPEASRGETAGPETNAGQQQSIDDPGIETVSRPQSDPRSASASLPPRIGHYEILAKLGEGGMGVVYSARDDRLHREVAIKTISTERQSEEAKQRFWREARAAASVNHPHVCQLHEIGEDRGQLFLVMELLEGETLDSRTRRGPFTVTDTISIGLQILGALSALHERGIIHRDLKPSNIFLTNYGVKLLDFGLARALSPESGDHFPLGQAQNLTRTGLVVGTPRYMSPEQVTGERVDGRSDLFALGAILFEMLAGRPPFSGRNVVEQLHATLHEQPPALTGPPEVAAVDRVVRRALAKDPADRPQSAAVMAEELRAIGAQAGGMAVLARPLTRLIVMPFRILRPDPETDFLAFSLPDAIATSISASSSVVVRSSTAAARMAGDAPDLKELAERADVDRVVLGTILRSGEQLQASVQLLEAPQGTILTSHTVLSPLGNLFELQADISRRVADALSLPLSGGGTTPTPEAPHDTRAYHLYLQANELARSYDGMPAARSLYHASLELDPRFAPAWAKLARCHWVIAKYIDGSGDGPGDAERALRRALELSPRLPLAHKLFANLESDTGAAVEATVRLLGETKAHGNDPELFAGLVHSCRFCGLFDQAIAAHREAKRLDPNIPTSYPQTLLVTVELDQVLSLPVGSGGDGIIRVIALGFAGRREEAREELIDVRKQLRTSAFTDWSSFVEAWLDRDPAAMRAVRPRIAHLAISNDPEAAFQEAWMYCDAGDFAEGKACLKRALEKNYFAALTLSRSSSFDPIREDAEFQELLAKANAGREKALRAFREAGGEVLLGS
jgi:serine/threonine protein kinase/tetratricopeptide (TPR) repeat protein